MTTNHRKHENSSRNSRIDSVQTVHQWRSGELYEP